METECRECGQPLPPTVRAARGAKEALYQLETWFERHGRPGLLTATADELDAVARAIAVVLASDRTSRAPRRDL